MMADRNMQATAAKSWSTSTSSESSELDEIFEDKSFQWHFPDFVELLEFATLVFNVIVGIFLLLEPKLFYKVLPYNRGKGLIYEYVLCGVAVICLCRLSLVCTGHLPVTHLLILNMLLHLS